MTRTSVDTQLAKIQKQMAELEKKQKALLSRTNTKALAQVVSLVRKSGLTLADIAEAMKADKPSKSKAAPAKARKTSAAAGVKVPPKYRNPADLNQTWTGRGKAPVWAQALRNAGQLDSALIAPTP